MATFGVSRGGVSAAMADELQDAVGVVAGILAVGDAFSSSPETLACSLMAARESWLGGLESPEAREGWLGGRRAAEGKKG